MKNLSFRPLRNLVIILTTLGLVSACSSSPSQAIPDKPGHHTTEGFQNDPRHKSIGYVGASFVMRRIWYSYFPKAMDIDYQLSGEESLRQLQGNQNQNRLTWLGHASFLLRLEGKHILTDPHLTNWAGPIEGTGVKRYRPPGISIENLPPIDIIVISHNHFDHLSKRTLERLPNKSSIEVVVPLGMKPFFLDIGYSRITELDWHESVELGSLKLTAVPAIHHSGRGLFDKNQVLWAGWVIKSADSNIFFAGDTAYSKPTFEDIGKKYGPFDAALVPIGAYAPNEPLTENHLTPRQAVQVGKDIQAKNLVAMHWGTFNLSDEPPSEPPGLFSKAGAELGYSEDAIWVMKIGESRSLNKRQAISAGVNVF